MIRITQLILGDLLRNKIVLFYALLLALLSWGIFQIEDSEQKGILTLLNATLMIIPLMAVLFSSIYTYNSAEFIELLVSQPLKRSHIWLSLYAGLSIALLLAFWLGSGIPLLLFADADAAVSLLVSGSLLTLIFTSVALLCAVASRDKARGTGVAILLWLWLVLLFDGAVLFIMFQFADYPIEKFLVFLSASNPVDLARIHNLLGLESADLLGYTGAIFKQYFGSTSGRLIALGVMLTWALIPFLISLRIFKKKNL